ncbi:GNAT family N-acetyltransferase [Sphingosinicella terrae]|uniref:GNAT family N-acetyltransferase n=1 Tax=Sphingosinicella terrae TaxID=2172047 RepID=UPI000E0CDD69|nr:GNAT family N-acetyltransferase [Sphingosinicella terrae]
MTIGASGPIVGPETVGIPHRAAPRIETARLVLRGFREEDLEPQAAMLSDPLVMRHVGGVALSREEAWRRVIGAAGLWTVLGYGYWAVERREDGAMIGQVGFADFKRAMEPSIEGLPEMGWIFAPGAHGLGYASEAVAAGLKWADVALVAPQVVAIIDAGNGASIRVAEKAGFSERETATYRGEPIELFRRRRA